MYVIFRRKSTVKRLFFSPVYSCFCIRSRCVSANTHASAADEWLTAALRDRITGFSATRFSRERHFVAHGYAVPTLLLAAASLSGSGTERRVRSVPCWFGVCFLSLVPEDGCLGGQRSRACRAFHKVRYVRWEVRYCQNGGCCPFHPIHCHLFLPFDSYSAFWTAL